MRPLFSTIGKTFTFALCTTLLFACSNSQEKKVISKVKKEKPFVHSPFKDVDVAIETFSIDPSKKAVITTKNRSQIIVEAQSLIDTDGNPIKEKVELHFKEFMSPSEIMTSGIPMMYSDNTTDSAPFQSAGMFELNASTDSGKIVQISTENPIKIELSSYRNENGFSNYYLDTIQKKWLKIGEEKKHSNLSKLNLFKKINELKNSSVLKRKKYFVFNALALLDVYLNDDYKAISEYYSKKKSLPKKLLDYTIRELKLSCYSSATLNNNNLPAEMIVWESKSKLTLPSWTKKEYGSLKKLTGNNYELLIENEGKTKIFKTTITAVMTIKSLLKFDPTVWDSEFESTLAEIKKQELTLSKMNDVFRSLQVNQFGIYNCDKLYSNPEFTKVFVQLQLPSNKGFTPERFFYVSKRDKISIDYKLKDSVELTLCNDPTASLYTVLENDVLATITSSELIGLSKKQIKKAAFKPIARITSTESLHKQLGLN